jgi:hypothetical protein
MYIFKIFNTSIYQKRGAMDRVVRLVGGMARLAALADAAAEALALVVRGRGGEGSFENWGEPMLPMFDRASILDMGLEVLDKTMTGELAMALMAAFFAW